MSVPDAACTGCVAVLKAQQQTAIQHEQTKTALANPDPQPQKLCTVVENGRVVVRPIQPDEQAPG